MKPVPTEGQGRASLERGEMKVGAGEILAFLAIIFVIGLIVLIAFKGKDLLKLRILQGSFFKQVGFVFSPPASAQKNLALWETGDISMPLMPVSTGFETQEITKRQFGVIHSLKHLVFVNGIPTGDQVLIISEKSYFPQDPNERLKKKETEKLASLNDIARTTHMVLRAEARKAKDQADILNTVIYGSFIIDGLSLIVYLIRVKLVGA